MRHRNHKRMTAVLIAASVCAVLLTGGVLGVCLFGGGAIPADGPVTSDPPTTTTTTTATTTTTTAAPASATTTTTTTAAGGTTTTTLMQYDTAGRYVQPAGASWELTLVNDWNPVPANYEAGVTMVKAGTMNQSVDSRIKGATDDLLKAGAKHGINVVSGYRSASHQATLYWRRVNQYRAQGKSDAEAQRLTGTIIKRPGYSEHNCGLAVDLGGSGNFRLEEDFEQTAAYKWLIENCAEYGFILRYPQGKEEITGVTFEPWHYRYVGVEAAKEIMSRGLCLEEYLAQ